MKPTFDQLLLARSVGWDALRGLIRQCGWTENKAAFIRAWSLYNGVALSFPLDAELFAKIPEFLEGKVPESQEELELLTGPTVLPPSAPGEVDELAGIPTREELAAQQPAPPSAPSSREARRQAGGSGAPMTDRIIGLAYVCSRWHSGQGSRGYRLLSRIRWQPRGEAALLLPREDWAGARAWAAHYYRRAKREPRLF